MATAIQKTFKCIEALARSPAGLTVSEVASVAGFSRPAATRLLEGLTSDSIIIRDTRSKRYRLGMRLYEWSTVAVQASTPINIARKEFAKLSQETGRECNFIVIEGTDAVFLERAECVDGLPLNRPATGRRVWFQTATGRAIIAFSDPVTAKTIIERTLHRKDVPEPNLAELQAELDLIKQRGYAVSTGTRREGYASVGLPILGHSGYAVAGLGTFMSPAELETEAGETMMSQIKATVSRVSHYLGFETEITALVS